ncbi:Na/Pi cotransporter family protein [Nitrincola sp. MINF-07-Sa-05]|uniref:Na/Pi cotransporter family protein n=1 Tax=Nitrincola salilacus TaxID=3400273 RepID=UPI003918193A
MTLELLSQLFGGIGLFLLGMQLMTNGLKQAAGQSLRQALEFATRSRLRGLFSGTLITALVQSSSAVTVATIGFVNAGLLTLGQSIAVIYGCNVGTTMIGWLVALIGFQFKISAFALPMIGAGMVLQLIAGQKRTGHLGLALVGFGIFFIGLDFMRHGFDGMSEHIPLTQFGTGPVALTLFVLAGFVMTFLMQASAAVMAIALSLVHTGSIPLSAAAAIVIGSNIGTTTTAILAAIGATANARRISAAHVIFNLLTGATGLILLMLLAGFLDSLDPLQFNLVILLALFHTLFNLMGVAMMWPLTSALERFLLRRFRSQDEDQARPRYLDNNIVHTPSLAVEAICLELARVSQLCTRVAHEALNAGPDAPQSVARQVTTIQSLISQIGDFNQELSRQNLNAEINELLPMSMRVARYYGEAARLSSRMPDYYSAFSQIENTIIRQAVYEFQKKVSELIDLCEIRQDSLIQGNEAHHLIEQLEKEYQNLKAQLLEASVSGKLPVAESIALMDGLSHIHRLAEQLEKGARHWSYALPIQHRAPLQAPVMTPPSV